MNKPGSDCFRFFMKTFFRSQPHHPDHQVVRHDAALKDGGICPKGAGADGAGSHLTLAPGDPVFTGGSLTVQLVNMPRSMGKVGHIAEKFVLRHGEKHPLRLGSPKFPDSHKTAFFFPPMTLMHKLNGFDPCLPFLPLPGFLTHEQRHQIFHLYLDEILTMTTLQKIEQISVKETTVCPDKQLGHPLG